jgi:homoserine kinase
VAAPVFRAATMRIRVPATSANLGPGFDSFGLALSLHDEVVVRVGEDGLDLDVAGEGADELRRDDRHLVVKSMNRAFDALGGRPRGIAVRCLNRIPQGRGVGSSAAAIVAGLAAAKAVTVGGDDRLDAERTLALATELEGHPDNVAAALLGGFSVAWVDGDGVHAFSQPTSAQVTAVLFVPPTQLRTSKARRALPEQIPHADATANTARAAALVEALTRRPGLLLPATEDFLHQEYRREVMPRTMTLVDRLRVAGVAAVVSGAGPSVLALCDEVTATALTAGTFSVSAPRGWQVLQLAPDAHGAQVLPL